MPIMKRSLLLVLTFGLVFFSCTTTRPIYLTELNQNLSPYQFKPDYDGIMLSLNFEAVGKPKYDKVFLEAARILGLLKHLNFAMDRVERSPGELWVKVQKVLKETLKVSEVKAIQELATVVNQALSKADPVILEALYPVLTAEYIITFGPTVIKSIDETIAAIKSMNPAEDFAGAEAFKIPAMITALKKTGDNLHEAKGEFEKLIARAAVIAAKVIVLTQDPNKIITDVQDTTKKVLETPIPPVSVPSLPSTPSLPSF